MRYLMTVLALAALTACDGQGVCTTDVVMLPIQVDMRGIPTDGFVVEALNLDSGDRVELPLDVDGRASLWETMIGGGRVQLRVMTYDFEGTPTTVAWRCDECHCRPEIDHVDMNLAGSVACPAVVGGSIVTVVDSAGRPIRGAIVTGRRDGEVVCTPEPTGDGGESYLRDCVDRSSTFQVVAEHEGRTSAPVDITWSCHLCGCFGVEGDRFVTLTLP